MTQRKSRATALHDRWTVDTAKITSHVVPPVPPAA